MPRLCAIAGIVSLGAMLEKLRELLENDELRAAGVVLGSVLLALITEFIITRFVTRLVGKTRTTLDDEIIEATRRPIFYSVILIGIWWAALIMGVALRVERTTRAVLITAAVLLWLFTLLGLTGKALRALSSHANAKGRRSVVHPRTIPVFDMLLKIVIVGAAVYFALLAWRIDPTAWIASAGILGIAIGFAAKDSLANLFAGIFIVVDAPYKLGDIIVLDGSFRGRVTSIGIRSTRILTFDDVEIIVPNSTMGNSMIYNEVGGPAPKQRVRVAVSVAYGSDVERVHQVLRESAAGIDLVSASPPPTTRFMAFGDSGLEFELLTWLDQAARREELINTLNNNIYTAFAEAKIEIPYPKHDVYIKSMPTP